MQERFENVVHLPASTMKYDMFSPKISTNNIFALFQILGNDARNEKVVF